MKRRATTDLGLPFWSCRLMTPEESTGDSRLERIEKRLSRLEDAISVLQGGHEDRERKYYILGSGGLLTGWGGSDGRR